MVFDWRPPLGLSALTRPEQNYKNDQPNDAPADPCDVRVSCLPFEDFLMDGHAFATLRLSAPRPQRLRR